MTSFSNYLRIVIMVAMSYCFIGAAQANSCGVNNSLIFNDALQSHGSSPGKKISFSCDAQLINNPDLVLQTNSVQNPNKKSCANTCVTADCSGSGTSAATLDAGSFKTQSGGGDVTVNSGQNVSVGSSTTNFDDIKVKSNGTLTFNALGSGEYKIDKLDVKGDATVFFTAGDYWINNFKIADNAKIKVSGSGTVRIYTNLQLSIGKEAEINYNSGVANAAKQLFIYGYGNIQIKDDVKFVGFIYGQGNLDIQKDVVMVGAALAEDISVGDGTTITYDSTAKAELDLGFLCPVVSGATHFTLDHAATGIYCFKQRVTVTAKQNANTFTDYDSTIVLDTGTSRGTWTKVTGNGSFSDSTSDDGVALYNFSQSDNGVAVFDLYYTRGTSTVDVEVYEQLNSSIRDDDNSGSIAFYEYGLVVSDAGFNTGNPPEGQVYNAVQTAGIADTLYLTAYGQTNPTTGACGVISGYTGTKPLKFWQDYVDPGMGTITDVINGTSIGGTESSAVPVSISFTNGEANVSSLYRDVGKIRILMKDDNSPFPLSGSTSSFIVKPAKFAVNVSGNPGATDHTGAVFKKAGEAFTATITSQDNDGNTTPNFGNESTLEKPMVYSSELVLPAGGRNGSNNDGSIGNGDNFSKINPGVFQSAALSFDEVGIIKLTAQISSQNYLGAGGNVTFQTGNIGRFIPDRFDLELNSPSIASGYSGISTFSYLGQSLPYQVQPIVTATAKSVLGTTTQNYTGNFFKIIPATISQTYTSNSTEATFNSASAESTNPNIVDNANGTATISFSDGGGFKFEKVTGVNASPFDAEIELATNITDTDNVIYANNPYKVGGTTAGTGISFVGGNSIYQGRLNILDNAGHEELNLVMPIQAEYFDGSDYIVNTLDSFTLFDNPANIGLSVDPSNLSTTATVSTLVGGFGSVTLSPPVSGVKGNVIVTLLLDQLKANLPYLQHDWDADGNADGVFDDNPSGYATFGIYEGKKNIIFLEEITD